MPRIHIQTRYSFLGRSGWKSEASQNPDLLFADERLRRRLEIFEAMTVPSLLAQEDDDFHWDILSSAQMPPLWRNRLRELVSDSFGQRVDVHFERPAKAGRYFHSYQQLRYGDGRDAPLGAQVVLDDDDALASDYVSRLRGFCAELAPDLGEAGYTFLSFPLGYWVVFEAGEIIPSGVVQVRERCVNLGLAVVGAANFSKNPYLTSHRVINRRHPVRFVCGMRPMYLRAVHGQNDSVPVTPDGVVQVSQLPEHQLVRFPSLRPFVAMAPPGAGGAPRRTATGNA